MSRPFVFSDRDGTLLHDDGYTHEVEDYQPLPGAHEALALLQEAGFGVAIVTNQSGVGRGYFAEADLARYHAELLRDFAAHGVSIDAIYHCPHVPDAGCGCRKPATGLIERACAEHGVDLAASWVVGDGAGDIGLARRAGCGSVLVLTGIGEATRRELDEDVPAAPDVLAAARYILSRPGTSGPATRR